MSKTTDKSHLSDAIYLVGLIHLIDEDIPVANATIEQSKAAATQAQSELEEHQRWLVDHQERYAEAVKECQRRLKRRRIIHGCKQTALLAKRLFGFWVLSIMARGMGISSPSPAPTETPEAHSCDGSV